MNNSQIDHIFECCKKGDTQQLLDALNSIENTHITDDRKNSVLTLALKNGHFPMAKALLENNFTFHQAEKPLLISACQCMQDDISGISMILNVFDDVNIQNEQKRTALMTSCLMGHTNKTKELIEQGADCNIQDHSGNTALIDAVHSRNKDLVRLIIEQNPEIDQTNNNKETALILELKQKQPIDDIVKQLLTAGADPERADKDSKSAWLIAKQKHPKISRLIETHLNSINQIELPFFTNDYQSEISTPKAEKTESISRTESTEENKTVVPNVTAEDVEAAIEQQTENDKDPKYVLFEKLKQTVSKKSNKQEWFHAAKTGNLGGLNRMIVEGIDVNCRDENGCTALIRASGHSRRAVVSFLIQQNADIEAKSENGSTALSSSIIGNCRHVAGLLLENGANPNGTGPSNYNYVTIAAAQWNDSLLSILYRNGADIFFESKNQQNLLHVIAMGAEYYSNINSAKNSIQFLLDHGMDINAKDKEGNTPLMILCGVHKLKYAVDDRNIASIVHFMIRMGAAAAMTNNLGKSAMDATRNHKLQQTKGVIMNALSWNN